MTGMERSGNCAHSLGKKVVLDGRSEIFKKFYLESVFNKAV
jgi:hypothetical protein